MKIIRNGNVRYRKTGRKLNEEPRLGGNACFLHEGKFVNTNGEDWRDYVGAEELEPLPLVPNWPSGMGSAPQYLSNLGHTPLKKGDLVLYGWVPGCMDHGYEEADLHLETVCDVKDTPELGYFMDPDYDAWLIQRRDPTEDIEHDD